MIFLELKKGRREMLVNLRNVTEIHKKSESSSIIYFNGEDSNCVVVDEPYEQIREKIGDMQHD